MKAITDTGIISAQGYMEEELSNKSKAPRKIYVAERYSNPQAT